MSARITLAALVLAGCGLGYHRNSTAPLTAPFHEHQDRYASFPRLSDQVVLSRVPAKIAIGFFERYYPLPVGFTLGTGNGPMRSWGPAKLVTWSRYVPKEPAEDTLRAAFTEALGNDSSATVRIDGVVTAFSWYELQGEVPSGRITVQLIVQRADGTVLYEGERSTTGRAASPLALLRTHVNQWLGDPALTRALQGGAS